MSESILLAIQRGHEALARGDVSAAFREAQAALIADPRAAQTHALLGMILSGANDVAAGEWHLRRALELDAPRFEWLVNLAVNLIRQGRAEEAEPYFARADALSPRNLQVLAQWSKLRELQGDLQGAEQLLERAAACSSAHEVELLRVGYLVRSGRHAEALAALEIHNQLNGDAQLERGRLYDRLGRSAEAWRDWVQGKAKLASEVGGEYRAQAVEDFFARLKQFFVRANIELLPRASVRQETAQPVFIIGLPRSGTTLLEQMLSSHSAVRRGGELTFVGEWPQLINRLLADAAPFPENLARTWSADQRHVASMLRDYYFARAEARGLLDPGRPFFVDKMPFNELWLPLIHIAFPRAKIVRIVRHPLDVCVSMLSHQLTHGFNCGYEIGTIVHQLGSIFDLTRHYRREIELADFTLRYEDLVRQPEEQIRRLLDYLGLPFETACLEFHERRHYTATPSYAQVSEKLNDRSIDRHRQYVEQLAPFIPRLAPWVAELGYEIQPAE
jgi:Tfp pilus assembly protein PilF